MPQAQPGTVTAASIGQTVSASVKIVAAVASAIKPATTSTSEPHSPSPPPLPPPQAATLNALLADWSGQPAGPLIVMVAVYDPGAA